MVQENELVRKNHKTSMKQLGLISLIITTLQSIAQKDAHHVYNGNDFYHSGKISESSREYATALELNPTNRKANFNLGNALYRTGQAIKSGGVNIPQGNNITPDSLAKLAFEQAAQNFAVVANSVSNKDTLYQAWHNMGNCYLQKKDFPQAVEAYKKALKLNPKDEDTRYNLAYALKNMPKDKKSGGGQNNKPENKKEENKNDKDKNAQPQQNQMNKEQADQLLKALMDSEKKLQDKRKQKAQQTNTEVEKDW